MLMTSIVPFSLLIHLKHHNYFSSLLEDKSKLLDMPSAIKNAIKAFPMVMSEI